MRPELFRLFDVGFPSYFVLLLTGFMFATAICALGARRIGRSPDVMVDLGIAMLLCGVAGGRILSVLADGQLMDYVHLCTDPSLVDWHVTQNECLSKSYDGAWDVANSVCHPKVADCWAWAKFWAGGLAYYGGLIGASAGAWFLLKRDRFPFWKAADLAGVAVPLGLAFGRMGCLLAGCCFGAECELPWAVSFPPRSPASEEQFRTHLLDRNTLWSHPVHPTQNLRVGRLARHRRRLPVRGAAAQALRRPGVRGFPGLVRRGSLPPRDPPPGRSRRVLRPVDLAADRPGPRGRGRRHPPSSCASRAVGRPRPVVSAVVM